jgi:peptidoglycan/LPS O-acetylase OafA/YrhL
MIATPLGYIKQLDGIRAIAVIFVILTHWFPGRIFSRYGFGAIGVDIFFVLSGFLITRILIVERLKIDAEPFVHSRLKAIKNFIIRRSLRIFPIYFLLLFFLIIFAKQLPNPIAKDWEWYFFYLQNLLFYINQGWPSGKLSHLWSLAVEEQFYLFWPWLILFVSPKWVLRLMVFSFLIGIASVFYLTKLKGGAMAEVLTPTCMQAFASGGILAYFHVKKGLDFYKLEFYFLIPALFSFCYLILGLNGVLSLVVDLRTIISIVMVGVLSAILINPNSIISLKFLGNPVLVFLGKISYGVYLFHNFIPLVLNSFMYLLKNKNIEIFLLNYNPKLNEQSIIFYLISFMVLVLLSSTSFFLFESKIKKFKYISLKNNVQD